MMYPQKVRKISSFAIAGPTDPAKLVWSDADAELLRTVLKYESASGALLERDIPNDETTITLPGMVTNGGGKNINEYSLVFDIKLPEIGVWHSLLQTDPNNSGDADLFIRNTNLLGVGTYFQPPLEADVWYRVVVSAKLGTFYRIYLNGAFVGEFTSSSAIAQIDNRSSLNLAGVCLFADDNGEDADIDVAEVTLWDKALSERLVRELGTVQ